MNSIETIGKKIDDINVKINYRIIELFSAGLYSSPNKTFEELICNSYDALADKVAVYISDDLSLQDSYIWVCDNGQSMNQDELKALWEIGKSSKRNNEKQNNKRLQIGQFGIGKLATYVLANKLTYLCKKNNNYLATTMDYQKINDIDNTLTLDERKLSEKEAKEIINNFFDNNDKRLLPFKLFGRESSETWTISILTALKPKATEIQLGRLKWVLRTALPINHFKLYLNGEEIKSSKISKIIKKSWVLGKDDITAENLNFAEPKRYRKNYYINFNNLKGVSGQIDLYEDTLVDQSKASELGRSNGIFLMVRNRLVNIDDPLLGMESFSHGPFNHSRLVINADGLDSYLTSTRESIKDSKPLQELKEYLKKKFVNEVVKYYFEEETKKESQQNISDRMSKTSLTLSKKPFLAFVNQFYENKILNPILIEKPLLEEKNDIIIKLKKSLSSTESIIQKIEWQTLSSTDSIAKFSISKGELRINLLHPFIANYIDANKNVQPLQFIAITEILTEAYLYEVGLEEEIINKIIRRRDNLLRELSLSERLSAPTIVQYLKDSLNNPNGLEDAVFEAFRSLGFSVSKIGKAGKPDGKADAVLGYSKSEMSENYSIVYDAKSTNNKKIKSNTARLSSIKRHQNDYKANYSVIVAVDYEGSNDPNSAISKETAQQKVTAMKASDLIKLLILSSPKQIGLIKLKELFEKCYTPNDVSNWITNIEQSKTEEKPIRELLETIFDLQLKDNEPPDLSSIRVKLKDVHSKELSKSEVKSLIVSLQVLIPGFISIENDIIGIQGTPQKIMEVINERINDMPSELHKIYYEAFK